jgi:hypothetical protein
METCGQDLEGKGCRCGTPAAWWDEFHGAACCLCRAAIDARASSGDGVRAFWSGEAPVDAAEVAPKRDGGRFFAAVVALAAAVMLSGCYTSHTAWTDGQWTRTVAFGPGAEVRIEAGKLEATTKRSPGAAMAGGAFLGSAIGSFFRARL